MCLNSTEAIEIVYSDLEKVAERVGDISPGVYERFFTRSEVGRNTMGHSDEHMRGRMLEQVLELMFDDRHLEPGGYLDWELENHIDAYGVDPSMYADFFDAFVEEIAAGLDADWDESHRAAWQQRIDAILQVVETYEARTAEKSASI